MSSTKPKPTHRFRVCGTPSRLGCITCKVRRVKCDETKPHCQKCTKTGRKCDGYEPPPIINAPNRRKTPQPTINNQSEDVLEQQYLNYFSACTAPVLSGNFSPDFWERRVIQAGQLEPSIRHAMIAIAAVHHDFDSKHQKRGEANHALEAFSFRQYTKAISHLHTLMSTTQRLDMTLITCLLFISFDCLLGNHASAVMHLKAGLKILEDIKTRNPGTRSQNHQWERDFAPPLLSLGVQVATFVGPQYPDERRALCTSLTSAGLSSQPTTFWSLDEARFALDSLVAAIMGERTIARGSILDGSIDFGGRRLIPALEAWSVALEKMLPPFLAAEPPVGRTSRGSTLLKIHALVVSIVIGPTEEAEAKFDRIISLCDFLIAANTPTYGTILPTFSCDQRIIAPLFFTAWRAPSQETRRQAINLLAKAPGREGLWDASDAYKVALDHLETKAEQSNVLLFGSESQVEAKIWSDIGARLKHRMTWNLEDRLPAPIEFPSLAASRPFESHSYTTARLEGISNSSGGLCTSPVTEYQEDNMGFGRQAGFSSPTAYESYNQNE